MKSKFATIIIGNVIMLVNCAFAQTSATNNPFGFTTHTTNSISERSIAVGSSNTISGGVSWDPSNGDSLAVGYYNSISASTRSAVFGNFNNIGAQISSFVVGNSNQLHSYADPEGEQYPYGNTNVVMGLSNYVSGWQISGNMILGGGNNSEANSAFILGSGNIGQQYTVTLGTYAKTEDDAALIVGRSLDWQNRQNGLVVYRDGRVSVPGNLNLGTASGIFFGSNTTATITASANGSAIFPSSATFENSATFSNGISVSGGILSLSAATPSTSSTTGALTVVGGIGVGSDSWINGVRIGRGSGNVASNTVIGNLALDLNTIGQNNTVLGASALARNTTGSSNIAIGRLAGMYHTNGTTALTDPDNSIYIGANSRGKDNNDNNSIVIGTNAIGLGANTTVIGNTSTTTTRIFGNLLIGSGTGSAALTTASVQSLGFLTYSSAINSGFITSSSIYNYGFISSYDYSSSLSGGDAYSYNATAMSEGSAFGMYSTAMSGGQAYGYISTALSQGQAYGDVSTAMSGGTAIGTQSFASGTTTSGSLSSASLGSFNTSWGDPYNWIETDPILIVGNGMDISLQSNAMTTLKNGQTTLTNKAWLRRDTNTIPATEDPDPNTTDDSDGNALVVEGHTVLKGKVIIEQPQGDISMGIYQ